MEIDLLNLGTEEASYNATLPYLISMARNIHNASNGTAGLGCFGNNRVWRPTNGSYAIKDAFQDRFLADVIAYDIPLRALTYHFGTQFSLDREYANQLFPRQLISTSVEGCELKMSTVGLIRILTAYDIVRITQQLYEERLVPLNLTHLPIWVTEVFRNPSGVRPS